METPKSKKWADDAALREAGIYFHNVKGPYSYNDKDYMSRDEYIKLARQRHPNMPESTFERLFSAKIKPYFRNSNGRTQKGISFYAS